MNSQVCIDANLIIRALVPGSFTANVLSLLALWHKQETQMLAPSLLAFEVTSVLRRMVYLDQLAAVDGEKAFQEFLRINVQLSSRQSIYPLAWKLAQQFNRPRTYDTAYLALAQLHGCEFWTADEKLYNAVQHELPWVKWVGNYLSNVS